MRRGVIRTNPDPAAIGAVLREHGVIPEADPTNVRATFDVDGKPRRIVADYADGWKVDLRLGRGGTASLTQSFAVRLKTKASR